MKPRKNSNVHAWSINVYSKKCKCKEACWNGWTGPTNTMYLEWFEVDGRFKLPVQSECGRGYEGLEDLHLSQWLKPFLWVSSMTGVDVHQR